MKNAVKIIWKVFSWMLVLVLLVVAIKIYSINDFEDFIRAEYNSGTSKFVRDTCVKYSKTNSYKIENTDYNDAMFYKKVKVLPNASYRVSCMIKTENVINKNENTDAGAHICINESLEKSDNVVGTSDWTKVEFIFDSKNRTEVEIGFRLGGNFDNSKGTAWFSDMKMEVGTADTSSEWKFLCLIFNNTDVNLEINGQMKNYKFSLSETDKIDMYDCMSRFENSMYELTNGKMSVEYEIKEVDVPIKTMSYDEENKYYVGANDIKDVISEYIKSGEYDHIFCVFRTGEVDANNEIPGNDWIGLGGMEYRNIGFSNVRFPNNSLNYIYKYDSKINTFPEEVFVHEFLHTLEKNAEDYGYDRPELHDYEKYGYQNQKLVGLKQWYQDYLNKQIKSKSGEYVGLPEQIFKSKPATIQDFSYSRELNEFKGPDNIFGVLNGVFKKIFNLFSVVEINNVQQKLR